VGYLALGGIWILGSDRVISQLIKGEDRITLAQTYKGWAYVSVTGGLLYLLVASLLHAAARANIAHREAEAEYQRLLDSSNEGVWILDEHGRTVRVNAKLASMLGAQPGQLLGEGAERRLDAVSKAASDAGFRRRRQGVSEQLEFRFTRPDGDVVHALVAASPIFDDEGRFKGALRLLTDATELRRAEAELRASHETNLRLIEEIDHRVRNNLASILELLRVAGEGEDGGRERLRSLEDRVKAMNFAHDLLANRKWAAVDVREMFDRLLVDDEHPVVSLNGPECRVPASQVTALACALAEIVSNARRHGALRAGSGRVTAAWSMSRDGAGARTLSIEWVEHLRTPQSAPSAEGTGLRLARGFVEHDLRGSFAADLARQGTSLRISFALAANPADPTRQPAGAA